jgi:uncharacterized membrane-anchored protein YitT (DUF2179 family)
LKEVKIKVTSWFAKADFVTVRTISKNLGLISLGSIICAIAINGILLPHEFLGAGFTGLALVIYYLLPALPVAWVYFLLNIPLFVLGYNYAGRRFFLYSLLGMVIYSCAVDWVHISIGVQDRILAALLAGIITGLGSGIILRSLGSAGGLDILSVILLKRFSLRLGTTSLAFNSFVLTAGAVLFSIETALYTLIYVYVTSYMINLVVTGLSQRKVAFIISCCWQDIAKSIMEEIKRGVTVIEGRGGYSGEHLDILYTVVTFRDLPRIKQIIRRTDQNAFMVVTDTLEVMGHRIGNQPHW